MVHKSDGDLCTANIDAENRTSSFGLSHFFPSLRSETCSKTAPSRF